MTIPRNAAYQSLKLTDNLLCYLWQGRGNNCNSCVFVDALRGDKPHVLVDPGHIRDEVGEPCFDLLVKSMEQDGVRVEDVGLVIDTHAHPDHCQASGLVVQRSQAAVTLSKVEDDFRRAAGAVFFSRETPDFTPLFFLSEGDLNIGVKSRINLQVYLTPGHTPGSICLYWPEQKILITGDVVFYGSIGRTDFPGGSLSQLKRSIDRLSELDVETLVPGHRTEYGAVISGKQNVERNFQSVKLFV